MAETWIYFEVEDDASPGVITTFARVYSDHAAALDRAELSARRAMSWGVVEGDLSWNLTGERPDDWSGAWRAERSLPATPLRAGPRSARGYVVEAS